MAISYDLPPPLDYRDVTVLALLDFEPDASEAQLGCGCGRLASLGLVERVPLLGGAGWFVPYRITPLGRSLYRSYYQNQYRPVNDTLRYEDLR